MIVYLLLVVVCTIFMFLLAATCWPRDGIWCFGDGFLTLVGIGGTILGLLSMIVLLL